MIKCVICCGGTGGHLAPGIALAEGLNKRGHLSRLIISNKEVDSRLLWNYPELERLTVPGKPFHWHPFKFLRFFTSHFFGFFYGMRYLIRQKPDVLIGFGGFSTVGMAVAAFLLKIPIILHEANRRPGRAIKFLSILSTRIYLPRGVRVNSLLPKVVRYYGYPLREALCGVGQEKAQRDMQFDVDGPLLLVLGGSQGAVALNQWVEAQFEALAWEGINVCCITGLNKGEEKEITATSKDGKVIRGYFLPFCDNMPELLSSADLAIARAGAGSIAEFIRCRLPSILIPYPHSMDDHQVENALFHERHGCGIVLREENLDKLLDEVKTFFKQNSLLQNMRHNLELLDRNDAVGMILDDVEEIVEKRRLKRESGMHEIATGGYYG